MKETEEPMRVRYAIVSMVLTLIVAVSAMVVAGEEVKQTVFASPEEASKALGEAVKSGDTNAMRRIFGPDLQEIANPDPIQCAKDLRAFADHLAEFSEWNPLDDGGMVLKIGLAHWPFSIPLIRKGDGWIFDTQAGKEEILNRRIGHNELSAIEVCHAYVEAQREYVTKDHEGDGVMEYAQRIRSAAGKKNGLYWDASKDEEQSPFGPLVAKASEEGYVGNEVTGASRPHNPFHGYFFRILKRQGEKAPGGKFDYVINNHMVAGFALLAYPAQWGNSGVMTFIVNQQGKVYEENLGEKTSELAVKTEEYNPDETWKPAEEEIATEAGPKNEEKGGKGNEGK